MSFLFRKIACFLIALVSCLSVSALAQPAQQKSAQIALRPPPTEHAWPALWKVTDGDTTIYLFGTIHALPKGIDWFNGPVQAAFDRSGELVTEITESDPQAMQQLVLRRAMLPKGESLRAQLSPEVRTAYEAEMAGLGLRAETFDGYEPWYAAIALSTLPLAREGYDGANGVEQALDTRAKLLGLPHGALETAEYQIGLFDTLPADAQKRYFAEVVADLPKAVAELGRIITAWKHGDAESLASLMNAQEDDPALIEMLLVTRNRNWAGWIKERLARPGTVFVAVGAGHLAGPGSLLEQVAAQGITAQRIQ